MKHFRRENLRPRDWNKKEKTTTNAVSRLGRQPRHHRAKPDLSSGHVHLVSVVERKLSSRSKRARLIIVDYTASVLRHAANHRLRCIS